MKTIPKILQGILLIVAILNAVIRSDYIMACILILGILIYENYLILKRLENKNGK